MKYIALITFGIAITLSVQAAWAWRTHQAINDPISFDCAGKWTDRIAWDSESLSFTRTYWECKKI